MLTLLTQREAARLLRLSERTLERYRVSGLGPRYVKAGRRCLYRVEDLETWITGCSIRSTSEVGHGR